MTRVLRRLLALAEAPRRVVAASVVLGALTVCFGAGLMGTAGYLISRAAERPEILSLGVAIVAVRFFGIGRPLVRYLERLASHDLALRTLARLRVAFYGRIEPLAPAGLTAFRRGDLLSRLVADVDTLQNLFLRGLEPPLVALLSGAALVGVSAAILPVAGVALGVGLVLGGLAVPLVAARLGRSAGARQAEARGALTAELVEALQGAPELVAYGREQEALDRVRAADAELNRLSRREALTAGAGEALLTAVTGLTVAAVLALAVAAHADGHLSRVLVATLPLVALVAFEACGPLLQAGQELAETAAAGGRLLELTDREPPVQDRERPLPAPGPAPAVALENVSVSFAPGLRGLDLRLGAGRKVALVGPSGAGKTTVANLLLRFLDPDHGRVTIDGRDLRDYRQEDVRRTIAVAAQDAHLFSTSIRENVRLARPEATEEELEDALRRAKVWDWVASLPVGLDTRVGEEGRELSGGQRQRIAIARALLADTPVLVLDEPTAHLDPATAEALVADALAAADERSVLLITHRPEGLDLVDEIVALTP
jgi:ATP-binding cassette, subfamily C, bacterial CydC